MRSILLLVAFAATTIALPLPQAATQEDAKAIARTAHDLALADVLT